ncbi:probable glycosyltransferase STELLO1 [Stylophora pistillata]|uniref:probable glycosyltransferase STELLO1 n=1 Tax=Stylophora pistillata TaxID=50429 RepID=UPI000C04A7E3|nr:probable glycosyltransferase STELLO1 [Stylophora pistillata]
MSDNILCGNISMSNRGLALFVVLVMSLVYGTIYGFVPISRNYLVPEKVNYDPPPAVRNEENSSCLRNAFSDIVLVVVFNFPFYSSIPTLSGLYKNAFPTIMFCGPTESREHKIELVQSIFKGYFGYMCMSRAMEKYPGYEGYLLIGDDVILNYWNLIGMDRNKIWEGPKVPILSEYTQPEKWSWWNSIYGKRTFPFKTESAGSADSFQKMM